MPNIKSSKKAVKVIAKKTLGNHEPKVRVKNLIKNIEKLISAGDQAQANEKYKT